MIAEEAELVMEESDGTGEPRMEAEGTEARDPKVARHQPRLPRL